MLPEITLLEIKPRTRARPIHPHSPALVRPPVTVQESTRPKATEPSSPNKVDPAGSETATYLGEVRARIEEFVEFPKSLQRRNLFGQVNLRITLQPDGQLKDLEILKSSGFTELDEQATEAVKKAAPFAPYEKRLESDAPLRFQVPLIFESKTN